MTILERIKEECKKRKNISITTLEAELGYSNGSLAKAKDIPSSRILEISKYLDVPMEYIMTGKIEDGLTEKDNKDIAKDLENIRRKLSSGESGPASYDGVNIPEDDLDMFAGQIEIMLRRLKTINKEKYNPNKNKK